MRQVRDAYGHAARFRNAKAIGIKPAAYPAVPFPIAFTIVSKIIIYPIRFSPQ
jgi:hypothetical protein